MEKENNIAVEMRHITKSFGSLMALNDVHLTARYGEVHAILGENGAGKSTLMSILFGMLQPDKGQILVNGKEVHMNDANDATALKIGMVHQHFKLVNDFTVYENIVLGCEDTKLGVLTKKESYQKIQGICKKYGISLSLDSKVKDISVGMQQRCEIVKVLYRDADILIFDEPTAVLTPQEITSFIEILKNFRKEGKAIILITHKLDEIKLSSDVCTILRRGKTITTFDVESTDTSTMASEMVGRQVSFKIDKKDAVTGEPVLEVKNLSCGIRHSRRKALDNVSLKVRSGEIVAIAGIEGNGQEELINLITGLKSYPATKGAIRFYDIGIKGNYHELTKTEYEALEKKIDEYYDAVYEIKKEKTERLSQYNARLERLNAEKKDNPKAKGEYSRLLSEKKDYLKDAKKKEDRQLSDLKKEYFPQIKELQRKLKDAKKKAAPVFQKNVSDFSTETKAKIEEIKKNDAKELDSLKKKLSALKAEYKKIYAQNKKAFEAYLASAKTTDGSESSKILQRREDALKAKEVFASSDSLKEEIRKTEISLSALQARTREEIIDAKNNLKYLKKSKNQPAYLDMLRTDIKTKRKHKLGIIPSDRLKDGLILNFDIAMNLIVTKFSRRPYSKFGIISSSVMKENAEELIEKYDIRSSAGMNTRVGDMSGGNQQKVILARETSDTPRLLIANQPTRGLDVGAIEGINRLLIQKRDEGAAVLLYSVELEDIMNLADRILVIHNGTISAELDPKKTSFEEIGLYMGGNNTKEETKND